jgi:DsbC/DsbD-like thiol-disulfide interchange protein
MDKIGARSDNATYICAMRTSLSFAAVALTFVGGCRQTDRDAAANNPVKWTISPAVTELRTDYAAPVNLAATIDKGWYIYSITQKPGGPTPMTVSVAPSPPFSIEGGVTAPAPVVVFDKEFNINTERYEGAPSFVVPVAAKIAAGAQPQTLDIKVRFQACNETMCLPAHTVTLTNRVQVAVR